MLPDPGRTLIGGLCAYEAVAIATDVVPPITRILRGLRPVHRGLWVGAFICWLVPHMFSEEMTGGTRGVHVP